jgi:nucleotide-binding universal stress UspA family protein
MERLLLYVEPTPGMARATDWALKTAQHWGSRVFAVSVLDTKAARNPAEDAEEQAWEALYEIEDDAFRQNIRISLLLEQGDPLQRVLSLAANYDIELVVFGADTRLNAAELVRRAARPLVFVR